MRDSRELQARTLEGNAAYVADAVERAHASAAGPHYYNDEQALRAAVKLASSCEGQASASDGYEP